MTAAHGSWRQAAAPLRNGQFRCLFGAQAVSVAGSALAPVALALGVLRATGSGAELGAILAAGALPTIVMLLAGGVWADRLPRHRVMLAANLVCALTQSGLGWMLLTGRFALWPALALQAFFGAARAFYFPASTAIAAQLVPPAALQPANALLSSVNSIAGAAGPAVAGVLVLTAGAGWALIGDGLSYVISASLLLRLRPGRHEPAARGESFPRQLAAGFRMVRSRSWIWTSIVFFMFAQVATSMLLVLGPAVSLRRPDGVAIWSGVMACVGAGQLIGDLSAMRLTPRRPMLAARLAALLTVPLFIALAAASPAPVLLAGASLYGAGTTYPDSLWYTALQQNLPVGMLSRVSSYDWMGSMALRPAGLAAAAPLAGAIGPGQVLVTVSLVTAVAGLSSLAFGSVRKLPSHRQPAGPPGAPAAA